MVVEVTSDVVPRALYEQERARRVEAERALEAHRETLQSFYNVIHLDNEYMQPGEKLYWIASRCILPEEKPDEDGMVYHPTDKISEFIGMDDGTVLRYAHSMIDRFGVPSKVKEYRTQKNQKRTPIYVDREHPLWKEPWALTQNLPEEKKRVINGNKCPNCKQHTYYTEDTVLSKQRRKYCTSCGIEHVFPVKYGPNPRKPGKYQNGGYIPQKGLQPEEPFAEDEVEITGEALTNPSTPPQVESASSKKAFQAEEPFDDAASVLLDIVGDHTSYIRMCEDGPDKYHTKSGSLTRDLLKAHLQGKITLGMVLRGLNTLTRALCFDADNADEWQRLMEAARLLATVGFKPLLIPSPADGKHAGGGHLWIIFDGLVDTYSAQQTIYQYTGGLLKDIKDMWPGGGINIRFPGGKYIYQQSAWCEMENAYGDKLTHEGVGAARALVEHQSSTELILVYEHPAPEPQCTKPTEAGGVLGKDVAALIIANFNASTSWESLLGEPKNGKYHAQWRGDRNPNVALDPKTGLAKDFSTSAWSNKAVDQYQVYCYLEGGLNWQEFRRRDLAERCAKYRAYVEEIPVSPSPSQGSSEQVSAVVLPIHPCATCTAPMNGYYGGKWLCAEHWEQARNEEHYRNVLARAVA